MHVNDVIGIAQQVKDKMGPHCICVQKQTSLVVVALVMWQDSLLYSRTAS